MTFRRIMLVSLVTALGIAPVMASEHLPQIAAKVVAYGDETFNAGDEELANFDAETGLVRDRAGNLNVAEASLNYAVALVELGVGTDRFAQTLAAVLERQDRREGSETLGLFQWIARRGAAYDADATLYLAPALAHLTRELADGGGAAAELVRESAKLALTGLLANPKTAQDGFAAAMWAGAVCTLGDAVGESAGAEAARDLVAAWLARVDTVGLADASSPTYDALRIGGLRWAWEFAADEQARAQAAMALELCYRDMLQRYDPNCAMVGGAIARAYAADYNGNSGVARYLLAADLESAFGALDNAEPLAMYFALSNYDLSDELTALAEVRGEPYEVRTRVPDVEDPTVEMSSACTWVGATATLGTVSGQAPTWSVPVMMTSDAPRRPTSYLYLPTVPASVQSAQSGPLAICNFTFDGVGMGVRRQVSVRAVLGCVPEIDQVLISGNEWIGEPAAVGQNGTVVLRRGSSYLGLKILECGPPGGSQSNGKPGILTHIGEGDDRSVTLEIYGRQADYPLSKPLHNVRVGVLLEVASVDEFDSLLSFARHLASRRVRQSVNKYKERAKELEKTNPNRPNEPKSRAQMVFLESLRHTMQLTDENLPLGLVEDLSAQTIISRTLPVELPPTYLWLSPALSLNVGGRLSDALAPAPAP